MNSFHVVFIEKKNHANLGLSFYLIGSKEKKDKLQQSIETHDQIKFLAAISAIKAT